MERSDARTRDIRFFSGKNDQIICVHSKWARDYRRAGWHDPSDMLPVIQLLDATWRGWNGMADSNQILALEVLGQLVNDLVESARDFLSEMRNGQVLYADAMQQLHTAQWDVDDDDDDYLPFSSQTSIDDDDDVT